MSQFKFTKFIFTLILFGINIFQVAGFNYFLQDNIEKFEDDTMTATTTEPITESVTTTTTTTITTTTTSLIRTTTSQSIFPSPTVNIIMEIDCSLCKNDAACLPAYTDAYKPKCVCRANKIETWDFFNIQYNGDFCENKIKSISTTYVILIMSIIGVYLILLITTTCFVKAKRSEMIKNNNRSENTTSDYAFPLHPGKKNQYSMLKGKPVAMTSFADDGKNRNLESCYEEIDENNDT